MLSSKLVHKFKVLVVIVAVLLLQSQTVMSAFNIAVTSVLPKDSGTKAVTQVPAKTLQDYKDRQKQIQGMKQAVEDELAKVTTVPVDPILKQKLDVLKKIEIAIGQYIDIKSKVELEVNNTDDTLDSAEIKSLQELLKTKTPISVRSFDQIKRDMIQLQSSKSAATREVNDIKLGVELGSKDLDLLNKDKRLFDDLPSKSAEEISKIEILNLQIELQELNLQILAVKLEDSKKGVDKLTSQIAYVEQNLNQVRSRLTFSKEELKEILSGIMTEEKAIEDALIPLKSEQEQLDKKWALIQGKYGNSVERAKLQTNRDLLRKRIEFNGMYQGILLDLRQTWESRYKYITEDQSRDFLKSWNVELKRFNKEAQSSYQQILKSLLAQHKALTVLRDKLNADEIKDMQDEKKSLNSEMKQLKEFTNFANDMIIKVDKAKDVYAMIKSEYMTSLREFDWDGFVDDAWEFAGAVWNYEVAALDDKPLTVRKVVIAIFLLIFGFFMARQLSNTLRKKVYNRFVQTESARSALQTISFYLLLFMFTMFALKTANIPLTMFTLLGGAFAIGIGFGSQNLINNFISGLILLAERPINVGDMIEVDGTYGEVKRIGARSTNVRTGTNIDIMVPNSAFLEKNVVNWTLTDDTYRTSVSVGVAYGSPVRLVESLLKKALEENEGILKYKPSQVLFANFGDSSIIFEMHFWIKMRMQSDRKVVESELRFRIDELFRENNIDIAYPQRDMHIDTVKPLEIKLLNTTKN